MVTVPPEVVEAIAQRAAAVALNVLGSQPGGGAQSPYFTIKEAAEYLRCSRQRIDDLLSQRRLTRFKDGARTLVSRVEVDHYLRVQ